MRGTLSNAGCQLSVVGSQTSNTPVLDRLAFRLATWQSIQSNSLIGTAKFNGGNGFRGGLQSIANRQLASPPKSLRQNSLQFRFSNLLNSRTLFFFFFTWSDYERSYL